MNSQTASGHGYWLTGWLESRRISSARQLRIALGSESHLTELRDLAEQWSEATSSTSYSGTNLVAGTGLRLDDLLTCPNLPCRRKSVDVLFRHAWHYFDTILLPDGVGGLLLDRPDKWDDEFFLNTLLNWIELVLYIQELGAIELVRYYPKARGVACDQPLLAEHSVALEAVIGEVETVLVEKGEFAFQRVDSSSMSAECLDPLLKVGAHIRIRLPEGRTLGEADLRKAAAHTIVQQHWWYLVEDLAARSRLGGTLGTEVWSHERIISRLVVPEAQDIAMRIFLPSLSDVPVKELIAIRRSEGDSFAAFRGALTKAAKELLAKGGVTDAQRGADTILDDIVLPELARLGQRLRGAERALAKKAAVSVTLGGLTTTCGLLLGAGPVLAGVAGVTALLSGTATAAAKYIEEGQAVEISDMYFLWKALDHA